MRTKRIKAANVRIGDVVYGIGTVESIIHLDRDTLDIFCTAAFEAPVPLTRDMDDMVEIVTHSNGKAV